MAAETAQNFYNSGPTHLVGTNIDWENAHHRRIIMASLVQGVYTLKSDIENRRGEGEALAPQWWELFNFKKMEELHDHKDGTIFGAIFKFHSPNNDHNYTSRNSTNIRPPKFVIAFRGTSLTKDSAFQDLKLDSKCVFNLVHESSRIKVAMTAVTSAIDECRAHPKEIWLAGHSLGAAMALSVGKDIAIDRGICLETYLFNPPCVHFPVATLRNESRVFKRAIRFSRSLVTAAVATIQGFDHETEFTQLSKWIPYMFLNKKDRISNEYIEYFKHRDRMARVGLERLERVATQNSITSLIPGASARPSHLLPVAYLVINLCPDIEYLRQAHSLEQWWTPQSEFYHESRIYDTFWKANFGESSS